MKDSQRVHQFVNSPSFGAQAIRSGFVWSLKTQNLSAPEAAHERPAAPRVLYRPNEEVVFGLPVPGDEADAGHEVYCPYRLEDGHLI